MTNSGLTFFAVNDQSAVDFRQPIRCIVISFVYIIYVCGLRDRGSVEYVSCLNFAKI